MAHFYKVSLLALFVAATVVYATESHDGASYVQWGACDPSVVNDTSLSCGFLDVPLDYHDSSVGNARLALVKANATGERRGTVLFNPGGPGGSGLQGVDTFKDLLLTISGGVYDVVSWDPRGVGNLTIPGEIFCFDSFEEYATFFNGTVQVTGIEETGNFTDPADIQALLAQASIMQEKYEQVGQKCLQSPSGKYLKYIGTAATVRDMVSIINALDGPEAPVNYFGISYGTLIGSWLVNMFPERVGRIILDGVIDPTIFATQEPALSFSQALISADTVYKALITGCALSGPNGCAAASEGDGPLDIDAKVQVLLKTAHDATRLNASVPITSGEIRMQLYNEMYSSVDWSDFMNEVYPQIVQIVNGEEPVNASHALRRRSQRPGPLAKRDSQPNLSFSGTAIYCADSVDPRGTTMEQVFQNVISGSQNISHLFGSIWPTQDYGCLVWPVRSVERYQGPFNKTLANPILVASNIYDPITPLPAAETLACLLGDDAVLVRQTGFGHTTFLAPAACVNDIASAYFTNGTLPGNNTVCEVDADFEVFDGVNTGDILAHIPSTDV